MKSIAHVSALIGAWLIAMAAIYWLLVPETVGTTNFMFISAVLSILVFVGIVRWRHSGFDQSIASTLYDTEHPVGRQP